MNIKETLLDNLLKEILEKNIKVQSSLEKAFELGEKYNEDKRRN